LPLWRLYGASDFFAEMFSAELSDISLSPTPVNPKAIVIHRSRPSSASEFYGLMKQKVERLAQLAAFLREETN
jgi:hypothetical protein